MSPRTLIAALALAAVSLLTVELALGARDYGRVDLAKPCSAEPRLAGGGFDATVQRILLSALSDTACELGTTREELVLSFSPRTGRRYRSWSDSELEHALRSGLARAVDDAEDRGELNPVEARALRELAEHAPVELVLEAGKHVDTLAALARLIS
jgi:hypothetical protein